MSDYDDSDDDDVRKDRDELAFGDMLNDLRNNQNKNLKWLLEEFEVQFDAQLSETKNDETRAITTAKHLISYFMKLLNDENASIRKFAQFGLNQIAKRFPDLYREIVEETK